MRVKSGLAEMLKGGVIMDVTTADQARIAEDAGAVAVMALERVPADIRVEGGVARMADPDKIVEIQEAVTIPVMAKARIGHFVEAQILEALEVDYIDESEVLTPADTAHHIDKWKFTVPFVCGCTNLGEALRRIAEGAAMIRTKGEAGTGDIVNAVTHMRAVFGHIRKLQTLREEELYSEAKELRAPYELVKWVAEHARLPVVTFTAGGIATPADAALCMQLGADGVFVGSGIFKAGDPEKRAKAIVEATTHYNDPEILARVSSGLGEASWLLSVLSDTYGNAAFVGWSVLVVAFLLACATSFRRAARPVAAGLFAVSSVTAFGVLVGALEDWFGWLAQPDAPFQGFHVSLFLIELLVRWSALAALRVFHFPLLVFVAATAAWYFAT